MKINCDRLFYSSSEKFQCLKDNLRQGPTAGRIAAATASGCLFTSEERERKTRTRNNHNANTYDNTTALMIFWKEKPFVTYFFYLEFASQHHLSGVNFFPPTPHKLVHFWVVDVQVRPGDEICEVSSNKAKTASVEKRCHLTYFLAAFYLVVASGL